MYSLELLLSLLVKFKYLILFPLCLIEGPVVTIMAAFLASDAGGFVMNVYIVLFIVFLADITGDTIYYCIGRWGIEHLGFLTRRLGLTKERIMGLDQYFKKHGTSTLILAKISHGLGWPAMVGAGAARMNYRYFISVNSIVSIFKSIILVGFGYYYGENYVLFSHYVSQTGILISTLIIFGVLIYFSFFQKKNREV